MNQTCFCSQNLQQIETLDQGANIAESAYMYSMLKVIKRNRYISNGQNSSYSFIT